MSRLLVHHDVMVQLNEQGVTEAMLLECTDDQVAQVVVYMESGQSGPSHGVDINTLVLAYIAHNKEVNTMTKSRTVGTSVGMVVGTASDKVVRGGIATKAWWDTDGKAATIATGRTAKRGILSTLRAIRDVAQGAAHGAKASYNANKADRK